MTQIQNTRVGLSDEEIRYRIPSVFAETPYERVSDLYRPIPTYQAKDALQELGFVTTTAIQCASRTTGREGYAKHILRLRHRDDLDSDKPDVHELVLRTSHDGGCSFQLMSGVFRLVCSNGLVMGDINSTLRVPHKGKDVLTRVVEGTMRIIEESGPIMAEIEVMKQIMLQREQQLLLAKYALAARFDDDDDDENHVVDSTVVGVARTAPQTQRETSKEIAVRHQFKPEDLLVPRFSADYGKDDLYTTFNTIQYNAMNGMRSYDTRGHRHKSRRVKGIDQSVKLNQTLWRLAQEFEALMLGKSVSGGREPVIVG